MRQNVALCGNGLSYTLPNDKILDVTKMKAFADDKLIIARMMNFLFDRVENPVGKRENAD